MRVVVLLEPVDIRQQDRERAPQAARPLHLAGERAHEMPAVVQPGQGIGEREFLQLPVRLFFSQTRHQGTERPRQVPDLAAAARGQLDRQVTGRYARRRFGEPLERAGDEQTDHVREESNAQDQRREQEHRPEPQHPSLTRGFGTRRFGHGRPVQLGNSPQYRHDLTSLRS